MIIKKLFQLKEAQKELKKHKKNKKIAEKNIKKNNFTGSTVGAAQIKINPEKVTKLNEMNQIQPTGLGVFGEQGPWNPIFRVLKRNMLAAQDFIENVLEIPLYQKKNLI